MLRLLHGEKCRISKELGHRQTLSGNRIMDSGRARRVAELVGVFSVVASLVFVGLEIRQGAEATRTATVQEVVDGWKEINIWLATDQSWLEARLAFDEAEDPSHLSYESAPEFLLQSALRKVVVSDHPLVEDGPPPSL